MSELTNEELKKCVDFTREFLDDIKKDRAAGNEQLFIFHIPKELLKEFEEKIVKVNFEGKTYEAIIGLMQEALDKQKSAKEKVVKVSLNAKEREELEELIRISDDLAIFVEKGRLFEYLSSKKNKKETITQRTSRAETIKDLEATYDLVYNFSKEHNTLEEFLEKFGPKKQWLNKFVKPPRNE